MKTTVNERYEMYIDDKLYMMFEEERAILRFVNRMHKVGLFTDIKIMKVKVTIERTTFEADYL